MNTVDYLISHNDGYTVKDSDYTNSGNGEYERYVIPNTLTAQV